MRSVTLVLQLRDFGEWVTAHTGGADYMSFQFVPSAPSTGSIAGIVLTAEHSLDGTNYNGFGTPVTIDGSTESTWRQNMIEVRGLEWVRFRITTAMTTPVDSVGHLTVRMFRSET